MAVDHTPSRPWADTPYPLLETTSESQDISHPALYIANEMFHVHNCMLRGLNAIYLQAPHVNNRVDARDLIFLTASWVAWLTHHHHMEEEVAFPGFEAALGQPGLLTEAVEQHHAFTLPLDELRQYATTSNIAESYDARELCQRIEALGPPLRQHLADEIITLQRMREFCQGEKGQEKAQGLLRAWREGEAAAKKQDMFIVGPMVLGLHDKTYESGNQWPEIPGGGSWQSLLSRTS